MQNDHMDKIELQTGTKQQERVANRQERVRKTLQQCKMMQRQNDSK